MSGLCGHVSLTSGPTSTCQVCLVLALALLLTRQLQDLGSGSLDLRGTSGGRGTQSLCLQVCLGEGMSLYGGPWGSHTSQFSDVAPPNPWGTEEQLPCALSTEGCEARW